MADLSISGLYSAFPIATWDGTEKVPAEKGGTTKAGLSAGIALSVADTDVTLSANSDVKYATQKAVKAYILATASGFQLKAAVRAATTANGTLASAFENGDTIDGVVLATNDRILIKNQTTLTENGIYTVNVSGAPTRSTDADTGAEILNASVLVLEGTLNAHVKYTNSTVGPITLGADDIVFVQTDSGSADVISNAGVSVDNEMVLFSSTTGKIIKRATGTGYPKATSGVVAFQTAAQLAVDLQGTGLTASEVAFRLIPQNSKSVDYTLVAADSAKHIFHPTADTTGRTFTIPANSSVAYPIGTSITFVNQSGAGTVTIDVGGSDVIRLAISGATGPRTLAPNGIATAIKVTATEWLISGANIT